jgi:DNA-binding YbaB/EbfC family protein
MSGLGDMGNLLKQAQEMQRQLDRAKEELRNTTIEGTAGGGSIRIEVSGLRQPLSVSIDPEVLSGSDAGMLEDLVLAALRDALGKAEVKERDTMGGVTGGMNLPGLF